ncbi:unnamed protein product [Cladocopium goreaui]|uniref:Cyclic nucleotide-binding domain-containing protein n=1 Tax=Cladocopium goreaui TaxID=2562237 RepID=A0A9P1CY71_9DINO|nr:unnamed protein product [Cladocopium goreaui]
MLTGHRVQLNVANCQHLAAVPGQIVAVGVVGRSGMTGNTFHAHEFSKKKELDFAALESVLAEVAASSERPEVEASMFSVWFCDKKKAGEELEAVDEDVVLEESGTAVSSGPRERSQRGSERKSLAAKRNLFQSRHGLQQAGTGVLSLFDFRNLLQWRVSRQGAVPRYTVGDLESKIYDNVHHHDEGELLLPLKILSRDVTGEVEGASCGILTFTDWKAKLAAQACLLVALVSSIISPVTFMWGGSWADPEWVPGGRGLMIVDLLCDLGYLSYLLLELKMSFLHPSRKVEVTDPSKIRMYRMTNLMYLVKLFSVTSYLWIISFNASLLLNLSKIVRLYHFVRLPDAMWLVWDNGLIRTMRPVFLLIWLAHWVGCLLAWGGGYREALWNAGSGASFETTLNGHVIPGEFSLYFMAFVEALYMLTGALDNPLGDGGYREKNFGSLIMVAIFGPVGCIIVAQIIATVVREQERKHALDIRHEENQAFVKRALENLNVPIELQRRVFSLHYFQKMSHDYEAFEHLFKNHTLSSPLEDAIRVYLYQSVLTSGFFSNKEHSYILAVVRVLEDKAFLPGDYVVRVGEVADEMYFISKGEVSVLVSNGKSKEVEDAITLPIRKRKGDHFGEVALIKGSLRTAWVKAETYVVALGAPKRVLFETQ